MTANWPSLAHRRPTASRSAYLRLAALSLRPMITWARCASAPQFETSLSRRLSRTHASDDRIERCARLREFILARWPFEQHAGCLNGSNGSRDRHHCELRVEVLSDDEFEAHSGTARGISALAAWLISALDMSASGRKCYRMTFSDLNKRYPPGGVVAGKRRNLSSSDRSSFLQRVSSSASLSRSVREFIPLTSSGIVTLREQRKTLDLMCAAAAYHAHRHTKT